MPLISQIWHDLAWWQAFERLRIANIQLCCTFLGVQFVGRFRARSLIFNSAQALARRAPAMTASSIRLMAVWQCGVLIMRPRLKHVFNGVVNDEP